MVKPTFKQSEANEQFDSPLGSCAELATAMLDPQGYVVSWSSGAERSRGYAASEIIGKHLSVLFTPQEREAGVPQHALEAARSGRFETQGWQLCKAGPGFLAHIVMDPVWNRHGDLTGFVLITADVTAGQRREQALVESELQFRLLVEGLREFAIYMIGPDGTVTNWNAGAKPIKGYDAPEILGRHFSCFYTQEDRSRGVPAAALEEALERGKFEAEGWRVRKDGSRFWAHVVISPVFGDLGEHRGFAKVTRDASEKRKQEEELRQAQEALLQSQKLQALGELAGGIAHDFNNLMTVVRGTADLLLRRPDLPEEKRSRYLHTVLETSERATSLTSQLLAFARRQPLEPEVIDLSVRLDALAEMIQRTLGNQYRLELDLAPALWPVEIDPTGLETAVLNAVLNARDAMPDGGEIRIATKNLSAVEPGMVSLSIADTGPGIPPEQAERVFEPFFTTKPVGKGTGLGLSQIHGFAEQSGGSVTFRSAPGEGAMLEIRLPGTGKMPPAAKQEQDHIVLAKGLHVLLVEDSDHVRRFARQLLEDLGCEVLEASSAEDALELLKGHAVDLVFSDILMPGRTGLELAQDIKAVYGLPVLLASGYSSEQFVPKDQREFPILRKPYKLETLAASINELVGGPRRQAGRA